MIKYRVKIIAEDILDAEDFYGYIVRTLEDAKNAVRWSGQHAVEEFDLPFEFQVTEINYVGRDKVVK